MRKRKVLLFVLPIFLIIGTLVYSFYNNNYTKNINIEKILKSSNYSYLSNNVKDYIKSYYNSTGEILLTEKNKVSNKEYLNPDYIEYLDDESNINTGYVPNILTYDYDYKFGTSNIDDLPRKYDSRNVNGNNYVTPTKKQYSELCWDYALTSVIESKLLKEGLRTDASTLDLSERMMDYATTDPISAIDIEKNPYYGKYDDLNSLSDGGNEFRYSSALVNGLFPVDEQDWEYENEYMGKIEPEDIFDFNKTDYQVNELKYLKDNNYSVGFDEITNKILKQYIIDNGSIVLSLRVGAGHNYISYKVSEEEQLNSGSQYNTLYYKDISAIYQSNDHMVAIIGWDDDYVHNVCVLDNGELSDSVNNNGVYSCSNGNLKTINGVWIIKDSSDSSYHYVAYETVNSEYSVVTDISYRDWDNVYSSSNSEAYIKNGVTYTFTKQNNNEKIESIKFYTNKAVTNLKIYINTYDGKGEKLLTTINTDVGGLYTIPITNEVILSGDKFSIKSYEFNYINNFSIFTSNIDNVMVVNIDDSKVINSFGYQGLLGDYNNVVVINGITRNVDDPIDYIIKDSSGVDVTNLFNITRNYPVGNYINSLIRFNDNVPLGKYTVYSYVNNSLQETFKIDISNYMENISGDGSKDNPFIITNPVQLDMIRLNKYNYYKLGNDIDLTYDTQNENGLFYNNGLGWDPISYSKCIINEYTGVYCNDGFSGVFDGNNHKIIGLYINRPNENLVGLFRNTYNSNYSGLNFRNIVLKDVNITGNDYVGGLIGYAYGATYERTLIFENISVTGRLDGNNYIGGLIGYFSGGTGLYNYLVSNTECTKRHCLNNLFNSSKIKGNNYVGGIVGLLETQDYYSTNVNWRSTIDANSWQNNGTIFSNNKAAGLIGHIVINNGNTITLNNSINTGIIKSASDVAIVNDIECNNKDNTYPKCSLVLNNIYYTNDIGYKESDLISANNVKKYDILDLTNDNIYNSFTNFNKFYKKEIINNIKRIPFVKNAYLEYSDAHDIFIDGNDTINLYDYIDGSDSISYTVTDDTIASIDEDGTIIPLRNGSTTIHITSYYDGYDNDINLVVKLNKAYTITKYVHDDDKKYIDKIAINTTLNDYKKNIFLNTGYSVDVEYKTINGKKLLFTGSKTRIYNSGNLVTEYTNIIRGDVSGDGAVNSADLLKMRQHLIGTQKATGVYYLALDITYDSAVNSADLFKLRQHLLGIKPI